MKQVMNYHKDNGLLNMIRRTDPMITKPDAIRGKQTELPEIFVPNTRR